MEGLDLTFDFESLGAGGAGGAAGSGSADGLNGSAAGFGDGSLGRHDPALEQMRRRRGRKPVVCRYFVMGRCTKGEACDFLHESTLSKMPECNNRLACTRPDCKFKHSGEAIEPECMAFRDGFCPDGPHCALRHVKRPRAQRPALADVVVGRRAPGQAGRFNMPMSPTQFWRFSPEGQPLPNGPGVFAPPQLPALAGMRERIRSYRTQSEGKGLPDIRVNGGSRYLVVKVASGAVLKLSLRYGELPVPRDGAEFINRALEGCGNVFLFPSIVNSKHFQGVAQVLEPNNDLRSVQPVFQVKWLRTCALPFADTGDILNPFDSFRPVARPSNLVQDVTDEAGKCLMLALFNVRNLSIDVSRAGGGWSIPTKAQLKTENVGDTPAPLKPPLVPAYPVPVEPGGKLFAVHPVAMRRHGHPAEEVDAVGATKLLSLGVSFGRPAAQVPVPLQAAVKQPHELMAWAWAAKDGFVVGCAPSDIESGLKSGSFPLPMGMEHEAAAAVERGAPILVLDEDEGTCLGLFLALQPPTFDWKQLVACVAECPPMPPQRWRRALAEAGGGALKAGPLPKATARRLAKELLQPIDATDLAKFALLMLELRGLNLVQGNHLMAVQDGKIQVPPQAATQAAAPNGAAGVGPSTSAVGEAAAGGGATQAGTGSGDVAMGGVGQAGGNDGDDDDDDDDEGGVLGLLPGFDGQDEDDEEV